MTASEQDPNGVGNETMTEDRLRTGATEIVTVLPCVDNVPGLEVLRYLLGRDGVYVPAVIVHPRKNAVCGEEIAALCSEYGIDVIDMKSAKSNFDELIVPIAPDFILAIYFDYILDDRFIALAKRDAINLHPGYLPYNKGFYYYAWAELDGTPAGVSIHRIVSEVDAGPIISQKRVVVKKSDTGDIIYQKHIAESVTLFKATWPSVQNASYRVFPQTHRGTRKRIAQTNMALQIEPYRQYTARELIDLLRVFSFGDYSGCTIEIDGKQYSVAVQLSEVTDHSVVIAGKTDNIIARAGN